MSLLDQCSDIELLRAIVHSAFTLQPSGFSLAPLSSPSTPAAWQSRQPVPCPLSRQHPPSAVFERDSDPDTATGPVGAVVASLSFSQLASNNGENCVLFPRLGCVHGRNRYAARKKLPDLKSPVTRSPLQSTGCEEPTDGCRRKRPEPRMNEKAIFCLSFLLLMAAQSQSKELVEFWKTSVTLSCPEDSDRYTWKKDGQISNDNQDQNYKIEKFSDGNKGLYSCTSDNNLIHYIYVKGKVCENCYELEIQTVAGLILGDLLVTGGVVIIVYYWAQRKSGSPPLAPGKRRDSYHNKTNLAVP
ncbi:CD3E protein, partial [Atractosteus spatula]|nr:CD3E protein [Atractosteus spatula]